MIVASRGAVALQCDCERYSFWIQFSLERSKYLISSFLRTGVEAKSGEFRSSASRIQQKLENGVS